MSYYMQHNKMILGHFCDTHGPSVIFVTEQMRERNARALLAKSAELHNKNRNENDDNNIDDKEKVKIPPCAMCFSFAEGKRFMTRCCGFFSFVDQNKTTIGCGLVSKDNGDKIEDVQNVDNGGVTDDDADDDDDDDNHERWYCSRRFPDEAASYARVRTACVRALRFVLLF
jgi:hypothetical protein